MLEFFEGFGNEFFTNFIKYDRWKTILSGLGNTVLITLAAILIGLAIGTIIALIKVSYTNSAKPNILLKILNAVATLYLTIIRGTPVLVQLLILYYSILSSGTSSLTEVRNVPILFAFITSQSMDGLFQIAPAVTTKPAREQITMVSTNTPMD